MSLRNAGVGRTQPRWAGLIELRDRRVPLIWRIATLGLLFGATLGGCAAVDRVKDWLSPDAKPQAIAQQPVAASPPPAVVAPKPKRPIHENREPKEPEKVASIDPNNLIGLDPAAVEKLLGEPSNISKGEPALVWTYTSSGCSFRIVFYPDLKTASFHALKYGGIDGNGDQIETSQACVRGILMARTNGPG